MRRWAAGAVVMVLAGTAPAARAEPATTNPLDAARAAAARLSFVGVVDVHWRAGSRTHDEQLAVRGQAGALEVKGAISVVAASGGNRMIRRPGGDWDLLWTGSQVPTDRPDVDDKYDFVSAAAGAVTVADRSARLVEVREGGILRERLYLDTATGLLLRLEQLEADGTTGRDVAFSALAIDPTAPAPRAPAHAVNHSPQALAGAASSPAPASLPGGYRRVGAYREGGAVQVLYSDGLYDLSVFEQRGRLRTADLPAAGSRVAIGRGRGWAYDWAGGHVLLWHAGHTLYSLVSDAPVEHLAAVAAALPASGGSSSILNRLRRACRALLEPFGG
jgi:hypothetical protein